MMLPVVFILLLSASLGWAVDHPTDQQSPTENGGQELMAAEGGQGIDSVEPHLQEEEALIQSQNQAEEAEAGSDDVKDVNGDDDGVKDIDGYADNDVQGDRDTVATESGKQVKQDILEHGLSHVPTHSTRNHVMATEASEGLNGMDEHQGESALVYDHEGDEAGTDSGKKSVPETSEQFTSLESEEETEGISTLLQAMSIGVAGCQTCGDQANLDDHDLRSFGSTNSINGDAGVRGDGPADGPDSAQTVGATGDGVLMEGGSKGAKKDADDKEVSLKEGKTNAEPRDVALDRDPSKQTAAASQSSKDSTEVLPQPSTEPPLPSLLPPLEFAVDLGASTNSHSITSNLHPNNVPPFLRSRTADEILYLINNIDELHEINRNEMRNMGVRRREIGFQKANRSDVEVRLGSSFDFDSSSAAVFHNEQYTLIMVPMATASNDVSDLAAIARNQRLIIYVDGRPPFLICCDPFANLFWLAFHAAFSDINEGFLQSFSGEEFHNVITLILNYILDEVDGQSLVLDQRTFLIIVGLLFLISELIHDGVFDAGIRNLVVKHRLNSRKRKDDVYRQQPSSQTSTQGGTNSFTSEQQNGIVESLTAALNLITELYQNGFNLKVMEETSKQKEQGGPGGADSKTGSATETKKKKGKKNKKGQQTVREATPPQSQPADVPNHLYEPQEPGAQASSGTRLDDPLPPREIPLEGGQPYTANNQGKTSEGDRPKKVSTMTQSKEEDHDPPSGA